MKNLIFVLFALFLAFPSSQSFASTYVQIGGNSPTKPVLTSFTPNLSVNTNCTRTGNWYKNADGQMVITYRLKWTGATGGGGSPLLLDLPSGYSFDQSRYLGTFDADQNATVKFPNIGTWEHVGDNTKPLTAYAHSGTQFNLEAHYGPVIADTSVASPDLIVITLAVWVTGPGF